MNDLLSNKKLRAVETAEAMSSPDRKKQKFTEGPSSDNNNPQEQQHHNTAVENSGMLDKDPPKQIDLDSIFARAMQMSVPGCPWERMVPNSRSRSFTGTGRTLAGGTVPPPAPHPPEFIVHNIIFWRNGFTVDDGPLRSLDDPENATFLECIAKAECPIELAPADTSRTNVRCQLIRKTHEDFTEPKKPSVPFSGVGRILGRSSSSEPSTSAPVNSQTPSTMGLLDGPLPSTSLQIRLADGTCVVAHFNYNHTVADIRAFIDASRPSVTSAYRLQTVGFPPTILSDPAQTIEQAGVANSVVRQKLL